MYTKDDLNKDTYVLIKYRLKNALNSYDQKISRERWEDGNKFFEKVKTTDDKLYTRLQRYRVFHKREEVRIFEVLDNKEPKIKDILNETLEEIIMIAGETSLSLIPYFSKMLNHLWTVKPEGYLDKV